jgi:hypothetical protein
MGCRLRRASNSLHVLVYVSLSLLLDHVNVAETVGHGVWRSIVCSWPRRHLPPGRDSSQEAHGALQTRADPAGALAKTWGLSGRVEAWDSYRCWYVYDSAPSALTLQSGS